MHFRGHHPLIEMACVPLLIAVLLVGGLASANQVIDHEAGIAWALDRDGDLPGEGSEQEDSDREDLEEDDDPCDPVAADAEWASPGTLTAHISADRLGPAEYVDEIDRPPRRG